MIDLGGIMMIEPAGPASEQPTIDALTRKMAAAWRRSVPRGDGMAYRGVHTCRCGAESGNEDRFIDGLLTNSLCVHYLAFHRRDVPNSELVKVGALRDVGVEPTEKELERPQ